MRRHAERDDFILLAKKLEFGRVVALVAIEDQEAVNASSSRLVCFSKCRIQSTPLSFVVQPLSVTEMTQSRGNGLFSYQDER